MGGVAPGGVAVEQEPASPGVEDPDLLVGGAGSAEGDGGDAELVEADDLPGALDDDERVAAGCLVPAVQEAALGQAPREDPLAARVGPGGGPGGPACGTPGKDLRDLLGLVGGRLWVYATCVRSTTRVQGVPMLLSITFRHDRSDEVEYILDAKEESAAVEARAPGASVSRCGRPPRRARQPHGVGGVNRLGAGRDNSVGCTEMPSVKAPGSTARTRRVEHYDSSFSRSTSASSSCPLASRSTTRKLPRLSQQESWLGTSRSQESSARRRITSGSLGQRSK